MASEKTQGMHLSVSVPAFLTVTYQWNEIPAGLRNCEWGVREWGCWVLTIVILKPCTVPGALLAQCLNGFSEEQEQSLCMIFGRAFNPCQSISRFNF